ncbi:hypothetical protein Btru_029219 [Bulinus truncatus]|nr:hypothetical protein Btru_029219 [Bulinus truncatus]
MLLPFLKFCQWKQQKYLWLSPKNLPSNKNTEALVNELEKQAVLHVLDNLDKFVSTLSDCISSREKDQRIQWTCGVWEAADLNSSEINKSCVAHKVQETLSLLMMPYKN